MNKYSVVRHGQRQGIMGNRENFQRFFFTNALVWFKRDVSKECQLFKHLKLAKIHFMLAGVFPLYL